MPVTLADLRDEVAIIIRDNSALALIDEKINEALIHVADEVTIPDLKRIGTFTTVVDQAWCTLPSGFNGKLLFAGNDSTSLAIADGGIEELMENDPQLETTGPVHTVAVEGSVLYYQSIPSTATSYPILYMEWPAVLVNDEDYVQSYIPSHLQRGLFIHYAAYLIFNLIEDGIEGEKVNTFAQLGLHESYLDKFRDYTARRKIHHAKSVWML